MAMTPPTGGPGPKAGSGEDRDLELAMQALRDHTDERWVEIADSVLTNVLSASRPSYPVRGVSGSHVFHVSEQVLQAHVLDAIDEIPHVQVEAIRIHTARNQYTGLTIVVRARHGLPLLPAADRIRNAARRRLSQILGELTPPISVSAMQVHVEDVTPGDPNMN